MNIRERTERIVGRFREFIEPSAPEPVAPTPPEPTREQRLASEMQGWVERAPEAFWIELDRWVRAAHSNARADITNHAMLAHTLGVEAALETVRDKFTSWRTTGSAGSQGD